MRAAPVAVPSPSSRSLGRVPRKLASITDRTTAARDRASAAAGKQVIDLLVTRPAFIHGAEPATGRETTA
jgi:hypothetical protein